MADKQKLCKDCKFCKPQNYFFRILLGLFGSRKYEFARCIAPRTFKTDIVSGELKSQYVYCTVQRMGDYKLPFNCSSAGDFFEPKE